MDVVDDNPSTKRRSTITRIMLQGQEEDKQMQAKKDVENAKERLSALIPKEIAIRLRDIAWGMASELPKDASEERLARLRAARSSIGAALRDGASVDQAATDAALRTVQQWVRVLKPFASGNLTLAELISRLVHDEQAGDDNFKECEKTDKTLIIIPPLETPFGVAMRRVVPPPAIACGQPWDFLEDIMQTSQFEDRFDLDSIIHRKISTSHGSRGAVRQAGMLLARPRSTPQLSSAQLGSRPDSSARTRLSGDWPWADFSAASRWRKCSLHGISEKHQRRVPGPTLYSDYSKRLGTPQVPGRANFPSIGDKRTPCITLPLWQFPRFFNQDYSLDR